MKVKAKIIKFYCNAENEDCFGNCNKEDCRFCDKETIFIDKEYKECKYYEDMFGRDFLKLGNKEYVYDEEADKNGWFQDTIFEYLAIDDKPIFATIKKENEDE